MIRIHINDPLDEEALSLLKSKPDLNVTSEHLSSEALAQALKEVDVLIVRSATKVRRDLIEKSTRLKIIGRAGVGLDNIDVAAAKEKGIEVLNTPGASAVSVAELTLGLMISAARHIHKGSIDLKNGQWTKKSLKGHELFEKTLGIIGLGAIGREVAKRAMAFGMKVLAYDPYVKEFDKVEVVELDDLFARSDFITLHVPLNDATKHLINKESISKMKDGVIIINASRGGTIDEKALYEGLTSGKVLAAGLDVFEIEPPNDELRTKLLSLPNVVATPHIGASTYEGQKRVGIEMAKIILAKLGF